MRCNGSYRVKDGKKTTIVKCGERKKWGCVHFSIKPSKSETIDVCIYEPLIIQTT